MHGREMAGTSDGAIRATAARLGLTEAEFRTRRASGQKWCTGCKDWHPISEFKVDRSRSDGLASTCARKRNEIGRGNYEPRPRPERGRRFVATRAGDKRQARRRVNYLIDAGLLPNPNTLACVDCQHRGAGRRHEYDHHLGYGPDHHEHVQAVCSRCHHARADRRGESKRGRKRVCDG